MADAIEIIIHAKDEASKVIGETFDAADQEYRFQLRGIARHQHKNS